MLNLKDAWAKADPTESVECHCSAVAEAAAQLSGLSLNLPILQQHSALLYMAGMLHDIGKTHKVFQGKIQEGVNGGVKVYHSNVSKNLVLSSNPFLAELVSGHHGIWRGDNHQYEAGEAIENCSKFIVDPAQVNNYVAANAGLLSGHPHLLPLLEKYLILADRYASSKSSLWGQLHHVNTGWSLSVNRNKLFINGVRCKLNDLQTACTKLRDDKWYNKYDIAVIEEPTGGGKTLASLCLIPPDTRVLYLCPTRMLTDETSNKLKEYGLNVVCVHGDAYTGNYGRDDDPEQISRACMSELVSLGAVSLQPQVCATIDQFAYFGKVCRYNVMGALENTYIIIDEPHSYDHRVLSYIVSASKWWRKYGCKIIFLSATLPDAVKSHLLPKYTKCGYYPAIIFGNKDGVNAMNPSTVLPWYKRPYKIARRKRRRLRRQYIARCRRQLKDKKLVFITEDEVLTKVVDEFKKNNKIAYIINNVKTAQDAYEQFRGPLNSIGVEVLLVHSRFVRADRRSKNEKLFELMKANGKALVIATQVIEHGHDLDFDVMFTRWAPVDRIIQRAGRLHRRRTDKTEARLYIIESTGAAADRERYVYPQHLEISYAALVKAGKITHCNAMQLINSVYSRQIQLSDDSVPDPDGIGLNEMHSFTSEDNRSIRDNRSIEVILYADDNNLANSGVSERDNKIRLPIWVCKNGKLDKGPIGWCFYMDGSITYDGDLGLQAKQIQGVADAE